MMLVSLLSRSAPGRALVPALLLGLALALATPAPPARAADSVLLPFAAGTPVRIIQGYQGGTHQRASRFGLDLVVAGGTTAGAPVLAPVGGRVAWAQAPGAGNGCLTLAADDGRFRILLCHVTLDRAFTRGEPIARGRRLGVVGAAGAVGNGGTPHVHLELHGGPAGREPVPFAAPTGLPLEGVELPASGARDEHAGRAPLVSSNGGTDGPAAPAATRGPAPASPAVVTGTGSCLRVRAAAAAEAGVVGCLPDGTAVTVVGEPVRADGRDWRRLDGLGWAAAEYLRPPA